MGTNGVLLEWGRVNRPDLESRVSLFSLLHGAFDREGVEGETTREGRSARLAVDGEKPTGV